MKRIFILDENVYIQSFICKDIKGSYNNYNSLYLILWILKKCHKIGLSDELREKYREKEKIFQNIGMNGIAIRIWKDFLYRNDKQRWCDNHLKQLPSNLEHDRHIIEPALYLKAILVTMDEKLKDRLSKWAEENRLTITAKSPAEILYEEDLGNK